MAVFTIADLHLSLRTNKPMDVFKGWHNYTERIKENWTRAVSDEDTVVVSGDISWAMRLKDTDADFSFINNLPGKKIFIKGNHDYWWDTKSKMDRYLAEKGWSTISILHNNCFTADGIAICGSRGWFYDAESDEDKRILMREVGRLNTSVELAKATDLEPIVFLHYPPIYGNAECEEILNVLIDSGIKRCFYGHVHGSGARYAFEGEKYGIQFKLISADYLKFDPIRVI